MFGFFKYTPPVSEDSFDLTFGEKQQVKTKKETDEKISLHIKDNIKKIKNLLHTDINGDIIVREFAWILNSKSVDCVVVSCEGVANNSSINEYILMPVMYKEYKTDNADIMDFFVKSVMPQRQVSFENSVKIMADRVNLGNAVIFIDGCEKGVVVDVKTWEHRGVDSAVNESVVQGPHEAFNEVLRCNSALVRKSLNCSDLVMQTFELGNVSKTPASLAYIDGVINTELLNNIIEKLQSIDADYVLSVFDVEKYFESKSLATFPQIITTERPDKVCRALGEGRAALLLNGSSQALILPSNITDIFSSPEDAYLRRPYSAFIKVIRIIAMILSLFTPGLYIAVTRFHPEAILTDMFLAIASARSNVPFSALTEILIMELSFELIKEACIRVPGSIGSSLGIVGGLILGQTAVSAGLVSPIVIIIVSVCGIASFAIPSYSLSFSFRISRFAYILAGAFFGMLGIISIFIIQLSVILSTKSFGVPICVPFSPNTPSNSILKTIFYTNFKIRQPEYLKSKINEGEKNE